jgi:hypothetical protein
MYIPYFSLPDLDLSLQNTEFEVFKFNHGGYLADIVTGRMGLFILDLPPTNCDSCLPKIQISEQ